MFLTSEDFEVPPYEIPNLAGVANSFSDYVDEHEETILKELMGVQLYDAFISGLDEDYPEERWINLRDGLDYLVGEKTYHWVGVKKMLRPYIVAEWLSDNWDTFSGVGIVQGKAENAKVRNPGKRIAKRWNEFAGYVGNSRSKKDTLYGYLSWEGGEGTFDDTFDETFQSFQQYFEYYFKDPGFKNTQNL